MDKNKDEDIANKLGYGYKPPSISKSPVVVKGKLKEYKWFCNECGAYLFDGRVSRDVLTMPNKGSGGSSIFVKYKEMAMLCGNCYSKTKRQVINYLAVDEEIEYIQDVVNEKDASLLAQLEHLIQTDEFQKIKDPQKQREYLERKILQING